MSRPPVVWTDEQLAAFDVMFVEGEHLQEIANELDVPLDRVRTLAALMPMEKKDIRRRIVKRREKARKQRPTTTLYARREPPAASIADRDRRYRAVRSITAEFFGDPRPGQSALDKRMSA